MDVSPLELALEKDRYAVQSASGDLTQQRDKEAHSDQAAVVQEDKHLLCE